MAVVVVWAAYLAVDPRLRFVPAEPVPAVHGLRGRLVEALPVPPAYRAGMRVQFGLEEQPWEGFLFGRLYTGSLWYYLPAALLVKTPLGLLALGAAGAVAVVARRRLRPAAPYLLPPPAVLLAAAMTGSRDSGTRYALFVPVFLAVAAARLRALRWRWGGLVTGALVLCAAVSSGADVPVLPAVRERGVRRAGAHPPAAARLERGLGDRTWAGSPTGCGSGTPASGCGWCTRAAGCRRTTASAPPIRAQCRRTGCTGCWWCRTPPSPRRAGRLAELIASSRPVDTVGHSISLYRR